MSQTNKTIKQLLNELETALSWFEQDEIELEKSLEQYKLAKDLVKQIDKRLETARNEIERL